MTKIEELFERLEDAASKALTDANDAGKVSHMPGIHMQSIKSSGELGQAIVALKHHVEAMAAARKEPHNGNDKEPRDQESFAYLDARGDDEGQGLDSYWKWGFAAGWNDHKKHAAQERAELDRLRELVNTPTLHSFRDGVVLEAAHQRARWGADHDAGKAPADWFWLVGYLAGKALHAQTSGNTEKALHHTISTAAALANWHAAITGEHTAMRPGIDPVAHGVAA